MPKSYKFTIETEDQAIDSFMTSTQELLQSKWGNVRLDEE